MEKLKGEIDDSTADFQLDEILKELGGCRKYQLKYCFLVSLPIVLMSSHATSFVFTVNPPSYRCAIPNCETGEFNPDWLNFTTPRIEGGDYDQCKRYAEAYYNDSFTREFSDNITHTDRGECTPKHFDRDIVVDCETWVYSDMNSIVGEFDLGCEQWKQTFVGTMNSVGSLFGTFLMGILSDAYGRKTLLISGMVLSAATGIARIFAPEYWTFVALEFLGGLFVAGVFNTSVIMCVEIVAPNYRVLATMFSCYTYALGEIILGLVAWTFPNWKYILAILYLPSFLFIFYIWYVPESIKWLLGEQRLNEITKIINDAADVNKIQLSADCLNNFYDKIKRNKSLADLTQPHENKSILLQLIKSKVLLLRLVICCIWFILSTFVYFGLTFNPTMLSGDVYLNFILIALVEIPGYTVYYYILEWYGRKMPQIISFILTGLTCASSIFVPEDMIWLHITLFLCGKFFITISTTIVYIYAAELFPTSLRGTVLGICSLLGNTGLILAPQLPLLSSYSKSLPFLLFGASGILCGITTFMVPDTTNIKLPDTLEEAENIGKKRYDT